MNLKKIALFILFFALGVILFGTPFNLHISWISPIFFIAYVLFLVMILRAFSKKKMIMICALAIGYVVIMAIPFPKCYSESYWTGIKQSCTCIGLEKHSFMTSDYFWSQCVGVPTNYTCVKQAPNGDEKIPCE